MGKKRKKKGKSMGIGEGPTFFDMGPFSLSPPRLNLRMRAATLLGNERTSDLRPSNALIRHASCAARRARKPQRPCTNFPFQPPCRTRLIVFANLRRPAGQVDKLHDALQKFARRTAGRAVQAQSG